MKLALMMVAGGIAAAQLAFSPSAVAQIGANGRAITITNPKSHPDMFDLMVGEGYRMLSIDIWGPKDIGTVTTIWEPTPGPSWASFHFLKAGSYQDQSDLHFSLGFFPSRVSHTGDDIGRYGDQPGRFACLFIDDGVPAFSRHGQTYEDFRNTYDFAQNNGFILESLAVYNDSPRLFASVWRANVEEVDWKLIGGLRSDQYQELFDLFTGPLGYGPRTVTAWKDNETARESLYYAVMQKPANYSWVAYHGVDLPDHAAKINDLINLGYKPRHIARGGYHYIGVWEQ